MATRPTSSQSKGFSNTGGGGGGGGQAGGGETAEDSWWEGFEYIKNLNNGCAAKIEMKPNGSLGAPDLGFGLKSPIADLIVKDIKPGWGTVLGPLTIELNFDLIFTCGRYKSLCEKGCEGSEKMNITVEVVVDFMLPDGPEKEKFKNCLEGIGPPDSKCISNSLEWLEGLYENGELPKDFYDMLDNPLEWWSQGMPFIGGPPNPGGNEIRNGIMKAMAVIMSDLFNDYKKGQMKDFAELCQCEEVPVSEQKAWIGETEELIIPKLPKWESIMQEQVVKEYNDWAKNNNHGGVDINNISIDWGVDRDI